MIYFVVPKMVCNLGNPMKNTSLNSIRILNSKERNTSIDIFRAIAIISVVLFHFNHLLPKGEVGVDLFFVISGLLVGGLLTKEHLSGKKVHFLKFFLQRGLKIWPSYFAFLIIGNILAFLFYNKSAPDQIIPIWDSKKISPFISKLYWCPFSLEF